MSDVPEKQCTGPCGRMLPATNEFFHRTSRNKEYGLVSQCKECRNKRTKEYRSIPEVRERNLAQIKARQKLPEVKEKNYIQAKAYRDRPEVKERSHARAKAYRDRPDIQEHRRVHYKEYYRRPEVKEHHGASCAVRRSRKKSISGKYTAIQIQDQLKRQKHKCYYCQKRLQKVRGRYVYHIDHTFPLSRVAGTNIPANNIDYLVLTCPTCNMSKHDKFPWEWAQGGRLL